MEHRLIWIYHHGEIPEGLTIDHRDMIRNNNHIENLRLANRSEQNKYQRKRKNCTSEYVGVYWHKRDEVYIVDVNSYDDGIKKITYVGRYSNEKEAAIAREEYIIANGISIWNPLNFKESR